MTNATEDATLTTALEKAITNDGLDDACACIQTVLGVTDGGIAGVCFSDIDDEPGNDRKSWKAMPAHERRERLLDYIQTEVNFMREN